MSINSNKNFIKDNKLNCTNVLKKEKTQPLKPFTKSEFGQIPNYLETIKYKVTAEKNYIEMLMEAQKPKKTKVKMEDDDRLYLLDNLKKKYDSVMKEFQVIKLIIQNIAYLNNIDTISRMRRKEELEMELRQLEKDIRLMSRTNIIIDIAN